MRRALRRALLAARLRDDALRRARTHVSDMYDPGFFGSLSTSFGGGTVIAGVDG